jgi:hypothetical protein
MSALVRNPTIRAFVMANSACGRIVDAASRTVAGDSEARGRKARR